MIEKIISAENLTKKFKDFTALENLNFEIRRRIVTAMIGPDGADKITFMRLVAGLILLTTGKLKVLGMETHGNEQAIQTKISYMPQKFGLYEDLTIAET